MKITELYFSCKCYDFPSNKLKTYNIFGYDRVLYAIATYKLKGYTPLKKNLTAREYRDSLFKFIFGDFWGRAEWEFCVCPVSSDSTQIQKVDVFEMYLEPNNGFLLSLVDQVSVSSCREWLRDYNERRYGKRRI